MYIVIAGAGRVGSRLASDLAGDRHDVVVIDRRPGALDDLGKSFNGMAIFGEAYDVDVLAEANLGRADVFCAMTNDDNTNLMAAEVAKVVYDVPRVIARLQDPAREDSYRALGIPYISTTNLIAKVAFETITSEEFAVHVTFDTGDIEIVEFTLCDRVEGMSVAELEVAGRLRVAAIRRGERTLIPSPEDPLSPGDLIVAAARDSVRKEIRDLVKEPS